MIQLLLAILVALLLGFALLRVLRADTWSPDSPASPFVDAHPDFIAEAVFSPRDWTFIQQEFSQHLNSLFILERRALAIHWLRDCLAGIHAVRANHLRQSRHSQDLSVLAEAKLLLLFFYLSALCRCLLFTVQFVHPAAPRAVALYVQNLAAKILPPTHSATISSRVPVTEVSRERL
jgi:hypothetical protein